MGAKAAPIAERVRRRTNRDGPIPEHAPELGQCWVWTGARQSLGYGIIKRGGGDDRQTYVHRVAYVAAKGPIPDGTEIDHLCRNRICVNPDHLEAVTHAENKRRAIGFNMKSHCKQGHPLSGENVGVNSSSGVRFCRTCMRQWQKDWRARKKAAQG